MWYFVIVLAICDTIVLLVLASIIVIHIPLLNWLLIKWNMLKILKINKANISSYCQRAMQEGSFFQSCDEREPLLYSPFIVYTFCLWLVIIIATKNAFFSFDKQ